MRASNFSGIKKQHSVGRGSVRKRRRAGAPFARLHRQTASTTTKGAGVFPPCGKMGARSGPQPAGRSAKRSGRIVVAPAAPSAFFLASASNGTPSRCKQLRPEILRKRTKKRSCKQFACRTAFCVSCVKISGLHRRFLMSPRLLGALFFCAVLGHPKREAKIRKNNYIICLTSYF